MVTAAPAVSASILVVEDELEIAQLVQLHLEDAGYRVVHAADGRQALTLADSEDFQLVVLDLMLPGIQGMEVCRRLRSRPGSEYVPILMLTAKSDEIDRVVGLESGADDYVTKPFSVRELVARVRAILRRSEAMAEAAEDGAVLRLDDLVIDRERRAVTLAGKPVELTAKEFDLLSHFATHPGRVFSRAQLLDAVWGYTYSGYEHTVSSHIHRLRAKIETDANEPQRILTVWGIGYKLAEPKAEQE